jgi:hypothetical protein
MEQRSVISHENANFIIQNLDEAHGIMLIKSAFLGAAVTGVTYLMFRKAEVDTFKNIEAHMKNGYEVIQTK